MPISKAPVTGCVVLPNDAAYTNGIVTFTLSDTDTEVAQVIPGGSYSVALVGDSLPAGVELWRNTTGVRGTSYKVVLSATITTDLGNGQTFAVRKDFQLGSIQVGAAVSYTLAELLRLPVGDATDWARQVRFFATRAELVSWAAISAPSMGTVIEAAGLQYRYIGAGTAIADLPGWIIQTQLASNISDFNAAVSENSTVATSTARITALEAIPANVGTGFSLATWAALAALTGTAVGQGAEVLDTDAGTHTDPVVGGTVVNSGRYSWSASPAGWRRIGPTGLSGKADNATVSALTIVEAMNTASVSTYAVTTATTTVTGSYLNKDTGAPVVLAGAVYKFWTINPNEPIKITAAISGSFTALAIWYTAADVYIGFSIVGTGSVVTYTDQLLVAPSNAGKVGISQTAAAIATLPMSLSRGTQIYTVPVRLTATETSLAGLPPISATLNEYTNITGAAVVTGSYIKRTDGTFNAGFAAYNYQLFTVIPGETVRVSAKIDGTLVALAVWYNSAGTFLSYSVNAAVSPPGDVYRDYPLVVPAGAVTMGMCSRITDHASNPMTAKRAALAANVATRLVALEAGTGAANPYWASKSVVWLGNSIALGAVAGGMYPNQLASLLGFALSKEATNGMQFRFGRASLITGPDPYGITGRSWTGVLYSLGGTIAEKQYLIDNWATVRLLLIASPPTTLTTAQQAEALDTSYENRLVARHLGVNRKDWYFFDNPYNDTDKSAGDAIDTDGAATETRGTYLGVMNFLIRKIREDNPTANIALVGHFESQRYPVISNAQLAVADYWSVPIMPLWDALGWSQRSITVNGSWTGTSPAFTWTAGTGVQTLTVLARVLPDQVHPSYDTSGQPVAKITAVLGEWMRSLR